MSNYVIDTHPLIWMKANKKNNISRKVKSILKGVEEGKNTLFIPAPVIWEMGFQYRARRFKPKGYTFFRQWVSDELFSHPNIVFIETSLQDVLNSSDFKVNSDPFDNLIAATANRLDIPLITKDESIRVSGACKTVW